MTWRANVTNSNIFITCFSTDFLLHFDGKPTPKARGQTRNKTTAEMRMNDMKKQGAAGGCIQKQAGAAAAAGGGGAEGQNGRGRQHAQVALTPTAARCTLPNRLSVFYESSTSRRISWSNCFGVIQCLSKSPPPPVRKYTQFHPFFF